jgi:alcohol dehydrogenase class IV
MTVDDAPTARLRFHTPELRFGTGSITDLSEVMESFDVTEPLVITDEGIETAGLLDEVTAELDVQFQTYYAATEPSTDDFDDLPSREVDGVVAIGGGSCIDTAKMAAVLVAHGGSAADYIGAGEVQAEIAPLVAIPTTSGTGSQATQTAVLTHEGVKRGASDEALRPDVAIVDPSLTYGLPRPITARAGFDAFVHALESLTARDHRWVADRSITYQGANPVSRALARRALHLTHESVERAVFTPDDHEARRMMSLGSHLAGTAFSASGLGAVHALASTVGGLTGRPHGECLAASVRAGLSYNLPVRREEYADIATELGVTEAKTPAEGGAALIAECERLATAIGLSGSFGAVGLDSADLDALVENTLVQQRRLETNPRTVTDDLENHLRPFLEDDAG